MLPMDAHPEDPEEARAHLKKLQRLNTLFHLSLEGFSSMKQSASLASRVKGALYSRLYTPWKLYKKLTKLARKYDYEKANFVGLLVEGDAMKERFQKDWLEPGFTLEFAGHQIPAPSGYKPHLEVFYGSHITDEKYHHNLPMILPDHEHEVYWKE